VSLKIEYLIRPASGESLSGDAVLVRHDADASMIAVIDVLGHGPEAAMVAAMALRHLGAAPIGRASALMASLHDALRGTRGAAASICVVRGLKIDGCGVGNVEIRVLGTSMGVLLTPGIVGQRLHRLREFDGTLAAGDRLVLFSDGISAQVPLAATRAQTPSTACAEIMERYRRSYDDATILVADVARQARITATSGTTR
jgi:phosphoserine phosphatase RsbX